MPEEEGEILGTDIPKCGGKAAPSEPPAGAGTGKYECVDDDWKWKETV